jgi:hypothetical protein
MQRKITITLDFVLRQGSQKAHQVTVERLSSIIGQEALELLEDYGYDIKTARVKTLLHTVRHSAVKALRSTLISVKKAG